METQTFLTPEMMDVLAGVVTQVLAFLMLLWVLKRYAWGPILKLLDDRQKKIEDEFQKISLLEKKYRDMHTEYADKLKEIETIARQKFQEEILHGRDISQKITDAAHKEAQEILARTKEHIEAEIGKARLLLKEELTHLVMRVSEKFIKQNLDDAKQRDLINSFVAEVEKRS